MTKKQRSEQTTKHEFFTQPTTADDQRVDAAYDESNTQDPNIQYSYARRRQAAKSLIDNPFGANYSPETSEAIRYANENELNQEEGQARATDAYRRKQFRFGNAMALRNARAPIFAQTGSTQTGSANAADFWNNLITYGLTGKPQG